MGLEIYKAGQGKWARGAAYFLGVALILFGGIRLYASINVPGHEWIKGIPLIGSISIYNTIALVVVLFGVLLLHIILNRPGMADLLHRHRAGAEEGLLAFEARGPERHARRHPRDVHDGDAPLRLRQPAASGFRPRIRVLGVRRGA